VFALNKNKFQLKREATYQQMLEAGLKCFSDKGYASTTLGDIVACTGHTKGAFYGHFKSKEELFFHVLDFQIQMTAGWTDIPKQFSPVNTTLEEVLKITLTNLAQKLKEIDNWIVVLVDFYWQTKHLPEYHEKLKEKYHEWVAGIEILVKVLQERGWVSQQQDTHQIAMQVIAFNEGFTIFSVLIGSVNEQALIQGLVKLLS
jgi:AcrR family transcriptional regulator